MDSGIKTNAKVCWINHWKNAILYNITHSFTPYVDLSDKSVSSLKGGWFVRSISHNLNFPANAQIRNCVFQIQTVSRILRHMYVIHSSYEYQCNHKNEDKNPAKLMYLFTLLLQFDEKIRR